MKYNLLLCSALLIFLCQSVYAQDSALTNCGQKEVTERYFRQNPASKKLHEQIEVQLADYTRKVKAGLITAQRTNAVVTLPVVVHIIHNNGPENISDATAMAAIQHLNEAFANTGFYDPSNGVNTEIQFCLAQRDPSGNATNGITRNVSPYTVMGGPGYYSDDQNVKNLNRWNPNCYINIWLVREIPGGVAGYAYFPSSHGSSVDGIVMEAGYFGSSPANDVVIIHEMGHYLGLYHTFEGACTNGDCATQGDRVCDTPPDQSTGYAACNTSVNSCSTDALSGFSTDQNDLKEDYMDYGNFNCMKVFTQGQKDRMLWHIQNVRSSLLNCRSCESPCPAPVTANFTPSATTVGYGATVNFTNTSTNASGYRWYVNGVLQGSGTNFSYVFNAGGTFTIRMTALSGSPLCDSVFKQQTINVVCLAPVTAAFTSSATNVLVGTTVNFTNSSTNANSYRWYINGVYQSNAANFSNLFNTSGMYIVRLAAISNSPLCDSAVVQDTVRVNCGVTANFTPLISTFNTNQTVNFTNSSLNATSYQWLVNNVLQGSSANFSYSFATAGNYTIKLRAIGATCTDSVIGSVVINDTCVRYTFQKSIGGNADDLAHDIQSSIDGGYIIAGRTKSYGNGGDDGYIIKLDNQGNTQWSKTYGGAGNDWFNAIVTTSDGGYAAVGRTYSFGNPIGDAWFVKMDANGNVQWSRRFYAGTPSGEDAHWLVQTPDGGYAIVGAHDAAAGTVNIFLIKLNAAGNILWNRVYDAGSTDGGMNIINDGNDLVVTGFTRTSRSYHDALLMKISGADGTLLWNKQYEINGWNNTATRVYKTANGYMLDMGAIDDFSNVRTGRTLVMFTDVSGNPTSLRHVVTPDYRQGGNYVLPMEDGGFVALHNEDNANPDFNFIRIGNNGAVQTAKKYPRAGNQINTQLRATRDGGFISIGYTGTPGNYDIYFVKTDILGNAPGCDTQSVNIQVQNLQPITYDGSWGTRTADYGNTLVQNVPITTATPTLLELCKGTSCVDPEPPSDDDTCNQRSSWVKRYGDQRHSNAINLIPARDGGHLVIGTNNAASTASTDGLVTRFDKQGNIIWSKRYGGAAYDLLQNGRQTADGGFILCGITRSYGNAAGDAWLIKTDAGGSVQWSRKYSDGNQYGEFVSEIIQTSDGGYAFVGNHKWRAGVVDGMVVRLDALGNVVWARGFGTGGSDEMLGIVEDRDSLVVTGFYQTATGYDAVLMKMNKNNGNVEWLKSWDFDSRTNRISQIYFTQDGYLFGGVNSDGYDITNPYHTVIKTDHNGNLIFAKETRTTPNTMNGYMAPTRDGGYVTSVVESIFFSTANIHIIKHDKQGNVQWAKRYDHPEQQLYGGIFQSSDGVYVSAGTTNIAAFNNILVIRTDTAGNTQGCASTNITAQNRDPVVTHINNWNWPDRYAITFGGNQVINPTVTDIMMSVISQCENIPCVTPPDEDSCGEKKSLLKTIGGSGNDEAYDVIATPDGGNMMVGMSNSNTGSNMDALIVKTDQRGDIVWSKTYGASGVDAFHRIIKTRDGNYVAVGYGTYKVGHASDVFIVKINPQGNVIWSKAFGLGTTSGEVGRAVVETPDGGFAIAADYNTSPTTVQPLYLKVDANGTLLWSKLFSISQSGQAYDIIALGNELYGTGVVARAGGSTLNDGYIVKMNGNNGSVLWTKNIESQGRSNRLEQMKLQNNQLVFTMYNSDNYIDGNVLPVIFKTDTSGNVNLARAYSYSGWNKAQGKVFSTIAPDGGYTMTFSEMQNNARPHILSIAPDGTAKWMRNYMPFPSHTLFNIISDNNGHTTVGRLQRNAGNDIILLKTNTAGFVVNDIDDNCDMTSDIPTTTAISVESTMAGANYWLSTGDANVEQLNAVVNIISTPLPSQTLCIDSATCEVPQDTCALTTFQKTFTANGGYNAFYIDTTKDGGSVIAGTGNPIAGDNTPLSSNVDGFVMKLAKNGNLQFAKRIGGAGYDEFRKIRQTSDGGFIAIGSSSSFGTHRGIYLVRLNAAGNVLWSKNFSANSANHDLGLDVIQIADGGFVFTGTNDAAPPQAHGIVFRTDANGTVIWHRRLYRSQGVDIHSVVEVGDTLVLGADYFVQAENRYYGSIIKMLKSNSTITSSVSFTAANRGNFATHVFKTATGYMAGIHIINGASYNEKNQGILRFDNNLTLQTAEQINGHDINYWSDITPTLDSGYISTAGRYAFGNSFFLNKANGDGAWGFNKRFGSQPGMAIILQTAANAQQYADGTYISANTYNEPSTGEDGKIHIIKTTAQGETPGCIFLEGTTAKETVPATVTPITWSMTSAFNYNPITAVVSNVSNVTMEVKERCEVNCAIDSLIGPDSVCNLSDTITYRAKRLGACGEPIEWTIDTSFAKIVGSTDTTISVLFKKIGIVKLHARMNVNCEVLYDSLSITIYESKDSLDLGPDLQLCKISTWPLNAGSGFKSYLWQDGTTDSTFTVTDPGTYHVTVTDFCGNFYRDTVIVTVAPDVPFDLGPDLAICDNDTLTITAPGGFTNYYWSPNYRSTDSYNPVLKVYPDRDTTYTVVAEKAPGCLVTDTIRVLVRRATPLDLGSDTAFCERDSVLLDASPAFNRYLWSNSDTTQQVSVTEGGEYSVRATDINGCISRDTVAVMMNLIPVVNIGGDTVLCENVRIQFIPVIGNAVHTYIWQDGSTNASFEASQPGKYWVEVMNVYGCKASDTAQIVGIVAAPTNFLADTVNVCDNDVVEIKAIGSFASYTWNPGGFNTPTITVDRAGSITLAVIDSNGCAGLDTVQVMPVTCVKQIFFPNAFTPNNDGNHDIWKPVVRGRLIKFHLVIFNRWGGKVYETFDHTRGWNGMINHLQQNTNTFVWMCSYQFAGAGQVEMREKGTLTLVR